MQISGKELRHLHAHNRGFVELMECHDTIEQQGNTIEQQKNTIQMQQECLNVTCKWLGLDPSNLTSEDITKALTKLGAKPPKG